MGSRLEVNKPALTMDEPVTVTGSGFQPGESVTIVLQIDESSQLGLGGTSGAQVSASDNGTFMMDFGSIGGSSSEKSRALGERAIVALGQLGSKATAPVRIVTAARGDVGASSLSVSSVQPGETATFWGAGFGPNEFVSIVAVGVLPNGDDRIIAGDSANGFGAFKMDAVVDLTNNLYTVRAEGDRGSMATAPFLVGIK